MPAAAPEGWVLRDSPKWWRSRPFFLPRRSYSSSQSFRRLRPRRGRSRSSLSKRFRQRSLRKRRFRPDGRVLPLSCRRRRLSFVYKRGMTRRRWMSRGGADGWRSWLTRPVQGGAALSGCTQGGRRSCGLNSVRGAASESPWSACRLNGYSCFVVTGPAGPPAYSVLVIRGVTFYQGKGAQTVVLHRPAWSSAS